MELSDSSRHKPSPSTQKAIPSTVCSYYANAQKGVGQGCLRLNCKFYHGTQEQLDALHVDSGMDPCDPAATNFERVHTAEEQHDKKKDRSKKPIVCLSFLADNCHRADCRFVHLPPHIRPLPTNACTYNERGMCTRARCRFFHGPEEALEKMTKDGVTMYNPLTNEPHDKRIDIAALDIARRGNESLGTTQNMYQVEGGSSFHHHHHQQQHQQQMYAFAPQHMQQHPSAPQQHAGGFFAHAYHQPQQNQHVKLPPPPSNLVSVHGQQHQYLQNPPFMNHQQHHHHHHQHQGMGMQPTIVFASPPPPSPSLSREMTSHSIQSNNRQDSGHLQSASAHHSGHHSGHLMVSGHHMVSTTGHVGNSDAAGSGHQLRSVSTADAEHGGSTNDPFAFRSGSGAVYQMPMQQQQQQVMNSQPQFLQASAHGSSNNSDYPHQGSGSHNDGSGYILQTRDGLYVSNMPVGYAGMRFER